MAKSDEKEKPKELVVPHDVVGEQVLLAAAALDAKARETLLSKLTPDVFVDEQHRVLWSALGELHRQRLEYDPATLQRLVGDRARVGYLAELCELRPEVPKDLGWHVDQVLWDRQRINAAIGPIKSLLEALRNPSEAPERVRALARHVGDSFAGKSGSGRWLSDPSELVRSQTEEIKRRIAGHAAYPYGIRGLDFDLEKDELRMLPGAAPGQVTVLTGTSGGGKSTLAAHLTLGLARQKRRVLYGSWEMGGGMTLELLACISLNMSRTNLIQGNITPEEYGKLEDRMGVIAQYVRFMKNPFRRTRGDSIRKEHANERNLDIVQEHIADSGCDVFIGDLWKRALKDASPEAEEEALYRQQAMAEEMHCHCILLQQQRLKDIEQRADKRPTREGIKGSSAWVDIADTIIATHRPAQWKTIADNKLEIFILKQRYGRWPLGVEFDWDGSLGSISGGRSILYEAVGTQQSGSDEDVLVNFKKPRR